MHTYLQLVLDRFDCYGTWLPGTEIHVGEIGELIGKGSFSHTGEIKDRIEGHAPKINRVKEGSKQAMVGASASRAGVASLGAGQILHALTDASVKLTLKINKQNSAALILEDVTRHQFADERRVRQLMQELREREQIDLDEVVVTYVLEAGSGFVAATSSSETSGEAGAGVGIGFSKFELGKVNGKLVIVSGKTSETVSVADEERPLTPMYRALVFRGSRRWWHFWKTKYTVDALIEASASLRIMGRRGGSRLAISGADAAYAIPPRWSASAVERFAVVEAIDVVSSSRPSLALAEQTLAELGGAGAVFGEPGARARLEPGIDAYVDESQMVDVYNNLGRVLHDRGDLVGAERQFGRALAWARMAETLEFPDQAVESESENGEEQLEEHSPEGQAQSSE
jgi:hypothetical protein